jgi:hypothetical protein
MQQPPGGASIEIPALLPAQAESRKHVTMMQEPYWPLAEADEARNVMSRREYEKVKDEIYAQAGAGHGFPPVMDFTGPVVDGRPTLQACNDPDAEFELPHETVCAYCAAELVIDRDAGGRLVWIADRAWYLPCREEDGLASPSMVSAIQDLIAEGRGDCLVGDVLDELHLKQEQYQWRARRGRP